MNSFYEHHKDSIRFHYRCFDRILLNGLIRPFQQPERVVGFFDTFRFWMRRKVAAMSSSSPISKTRSPTRSSPC